MKYSIKLIALLFVAIITLSSCSQETETPESPVSNQISKLSTNEITECTIPVKDGSFSFESISTTSSSDYLTLTNINCLVNRDLVKEFVASLVPGYEDPRGIVLIYNDNSSEWNNLIGFSLFYVENNQKLHTYFQKNGVNISEITEYKLPTPSAVPVAFDIHYILNGKQVASNNMRLIRLITGMDDNGLESNNAEIVHKLAYDLRFDLQGDETNDINKDDEGCGTYDGCVTGTPEKHICKPNILNDGSNPHAPLFWCYPKGWCPDKEEKVLLEKNNELDLANQAFNLDLHYSLKDNFLSKTKYGNTLMKYYRALRYVTSDKLTFELSYETAKVMLDFNNTIVRVMNPLEYKDALLFDPGVPQDMISLLNQYRALDNSVVYTDIIDDVKSDVQFLSNKTVGEFCELIHYQY